MPISGLDEPKTDAKVGTTNGDLQQQLATTESDSTMAYMGNSLGIDPDEYSSDNPYGHPDDDSNSDKFSDVMRVLTDSGYVYDYADEYGEPGYSNDNDGPVVLGDYWCKCGKLDENGRKDLHGAENCEMRHEFEFLAATGAEFEWCDEWMVDYAGISKAYRTEPNSYSWQPSVILDDQGEWLTPDTDIEYWIEWATDEWDGHSKVIPTHIIADSQLIEAGFELVEAGLENGWHPGQDADPKALKASYIAEHSEDEDGDERRIEVLFRLSDVGQFDVRFQMWARAEDDE